MKSKIAYLCVPCPRAREGNEKYFIEKAARAAAELMERGYSVFCPIIQNNSVSEHLESSPDASFWLKKNKPFILAAERFFVLLMPGWEQSRDVINQIEIAQRFDVEIEYLTP